MKKLLLCTAIAAFAAMAGEWKGAISDSHCGAKHADGKGEACVTACVKKGADPVFVSDGKVLKIANKDKAMDHLGKLVTVTGNLEGETIRIETIRQ